ncbi:MAG: hypothetical protein JRI50_04600 [Deltaproteobacteria bacterium]|nr:hypothetical protein [Deltaproteobacteria bacterium]MBW2135076.1 hypothetical protein [Deltaproteobacteria bacterium]
MYRHIQRVAVFVQRFPVYLQMQGANRLGEDFIEDRTIFVGPWEPAEQINPRAVDVSDIDDELMGKIIVRALEKKGYQPFFADFTTFGSKAMDVGGIMTRYRLVDPSVEAFLFCFYSPTLYFADVQATPSDHAQRSYSLGEVVQLLNPGGSSVIWAGPRAARAPGQAISHAFIYVSMTFFTARDWRPLWKVADSHVGGRVRVALTRCPPAPTEKNYPADAGVIKRLMCQNLACRLRHLIPDAF